MRREILLVLLLLAPSALAAEQCVVQGSADYVCYGKSELSPPTMCDAYGSFQSCCLDHPDLLGIKIADESAPECRQACCCDGTGGALAPDTVSVSTCQALSGQVQQVGQDCVAVCGGAGGGTSRRATVSGTVTDAGTPLADAIVTHANGLLDPTDSQGSYSIANVPATVATLSAAKAGCGEQVKSIDLTQGDGVVDFQLDCATGGCVASPVTDVRAAAVIGRQSATITWTSGSCSEISGYTILRCEGANGACSGLQQPIGAVPRGQAGLFVDLSVPAATGVCYAVTERTRDGTEVASQAMACIGPMDEWCIGQAAPGPRCYNDHPSVSLGDDVFYGVARCDANNQLAVVQECSGGQLCYNDGTGPRCGSATDCSRCNGPFGWFTDPIARLNTSECGLLRQCILDNNEYAANTYAACSETKSCYGYRTQQACEGTAGIDQCGVPDGPCQWQPSPALQELSIGVCAPKVVRPGTAACGQCDELFGFCNEELCGSLGSCYYNSKSGTTFGGLEPLGCIAKEEAACAFYDDSESCIGGRPVSVSAQYSGTTRVGGTHAIIPSEDTLGLGRCSWVGKCVKDANGYASGQDDCSEPGAGGQPLTCLRDNEAPITMLPLYDGQEVTLSQLRTLTPIVSDNAYPGRELMTYACLVPVGQSCYPTSTFTSLTLPGASAVMLRYYSADAAGNLERVQEITLTIRVDSNITLMSARLVDT